MFPTWFNFLKRSPRAGDGKDRIMSHPTSPPPTPESPGTAVPGTATPAAPAAPPDVAKQIADLTDAVNRLVQAQSAQRPAQPSAVPVPDASLDVGGDIPGGAPLAPSVDYAKLSPVQQIALGLRDAKPVGPGRAIAASSAPTASRDDVGASANGAD